MNPLVRNALFSMFQVIASAVALFFLYRYLVRSLGIEQLGIWSVVISAASANKVGEIGLSGGMIKYVSKYLSLDDTTAVSEIIQTGALTIACSVGILLIFTYPLIVIALGLILPGTADEIVSEIIPIALISLWINSVASISISSIEGCQRYDKRSFLLILNSFVLLIGAFICVPRWGLVGVAWAYLIQAIVNLFCSWVLLRIELPFLPYLPFRWQLSRFREMLSYGANIQLATVIGMLYEPTTKLILSKFGGLAMTGYYEMANRMILQFRGLLVSANQVVVPVIADIKEKAPDKIYDYFTSSYDFFLFLSIPYYMALILMVPAISEIWIGGVEPAFVTFAIMLSIGWLINTLNSPAYFIYLGIGRLKYNTISHISIGCMNILLNLSLGYLFGGYGVVFGWAFSLSAGSMIITIAYLHENRRSLSHLFPPHSRKLIAANLICTILLFIAFYQLKLIDSFLISGVLSAAVLTTIVLIVFWSHPVRRKIFEVVKVSFF